MERSFWKRTKLLEVEMSDPQSDGWTPPTGENAIEQPPKLSEEEREALIADFAKRAVAEEGPQLEAARAFTGGAQQGLMSSLGSPALHNSTTGFIPFKQISAAREGHTLVFALDIHGMLWRLSLAEPESGWVMIGNPTLKRAQAEMRRLGEEILDAELEIGEDDAEPPQHDEASKGNGSGE
jgi:hypothetical protein